LPVVVGGEGGREGGEEEPAYLMSAVPGLYLAHRKVSAGGGGGGREGGREGGKEVKVEVAPLVARRWGKASPAASQGGRGEK